MFTSLYDILIVLLKKRKLILWVTFSFTIVAIIVSFIIPVKFKATATLMPPVSQSTNLMSLMMRGNMMSDPEIGGTGYMPGMITPSDVFSYMLKSSSVADIVINDCDLVKHYKEDKVFSKKPDKAMYNVAKKLKKATKFNVTEERFISITVEDTSKIKAAEIANCYGTALDRVYSRLTMTQGGRMREFIEKRVQQEQVVLMSMEDSLKRFQQRYRTVSISDEMKAVIEMVSTLEAKILGQKIELDALKTYSGPDNMQVKVLQNQIDKAQQELDKMMKGGRSETLFTAFSNAPEVGMRFTQVTRDVRIHQELYALLVQQLEQARILEAKDTPKIQFLERATPPYKKSWPLRSIIALFGMFVGLLIGCALTIGNYWLEWIRSDDKRHEKVSEVVKYFSLDI